MSQGGLGFKYEEEKQEKGMTGLVGLPLYVELLHATPFPLLVLDKTLNGVLEESSPKMIPAFSDHKRRTPHRGEMQAFSAIDRARTSDRLNV